MKIKKVSTVSSHGEVNEYQEKHHFEFNGELLSRKLKKYHIDDGQKWVNTITVVDASTVGHIRYRRIAHFDVCLIKLKRLFLRILIFTCIIFYELFLKKYFKIK